MNTSLFHERLNWSKGECSSRNKIESIFRDKLANYSHYEEANEADDRNGTDYWIHRTGADLRPLSVDAKVRDLDPIVVFKLDDVAIETWSVVEKEIVGWSRDPEKNSDYIPWLFPVTDQFPYGRYVLVPFMMLRQVTSKFWKVWKNEFRWKRQETKRGTGSYHSECVFVPVRTLWAAIYKESKEPVPALKLAETTSIPAVPSDAQQGAFPFTGASS